MKYLWIALLSIILTGCASYDSSDRTPAAEQTVDQGITAESYNMNR